LGLTPPSEGFPWNDLHKILRLNAVEKLPKIFYRVSRVHERYRRQTDGRQPTANVNVSLRSLKSPYLAPPLAFNRPDGKLPYDTIATGISLKLDTLGYISVSEV